MSLYSITYNGPFKRRMVWNITFDSYDAAEKAFKHHYTYQRQEDTEKQDPKIVELVEREK